MAYLCSKTPRSLRFSIIQYCSLGLQFSHGLCFMLMLMHAKVQTVKTVIWPIKKSFLSKSLLQRPFFQRQKELAHVINTKAVIPRSGLIQSRIMSGLIHNSPFKVTAEQHTTGFFYQYAMNLYDIFRRNCVQRFFFLHFAKILQTAVVLHFLDPTFET